jgi:hypothetical protein
MASYTNITEQGTFTLKAERGRLMRVVLNKATANGVVTVYDSTDGSGVTVATITSPAALLQSHTVLTYKAELQVGLTVVTSGANQDVTVMWD